MRIPHLRLVGGRSLSAFATALIPLTLTLAIVRETGSAGDLGLVLACEMTPVVLLLPVAGVVADRFRPEHVIRAADLVRAAAQLAIGFELLAGTVEIAHLAVLAAITGVGVAFGVPAVPRLVKAAVPEDELLRVNARLGGVRSIAELAAPAAAGGVILAAGPGWSSLATAVLFLCSALTLGGIRTKPVGVKDVKPTVLGDFKDGWAEARRHPWFLASVLSHLCWHLAAGFLLTLGPLIAIRHLGGEATWVLIMQLGAVGMVAGVFAAPRLPIRRPLVVVVFGGAAYALPLIALAATAPTPVIAAAYLAAMAGLGFLIPLWETEMQKRIPEHALGRVSSFDGLISFAARPLGLAAAAPIAAVTGTAAPLLVGALLVTGSHLAVLVFLKGSGPAVELSEGRRTM